MRDSSQVSLISRWERELCFLPNAYFEQRHTLNKRDPLASVRIEV